MDPAYLNMDSCMVDTTDESRMKATCQEVKEFCEKQEEGGMEVCLLTEKHNMCIELWKVLSQTLSEDYEQ